MIMESTVLYSCCARFPIRRGIENLRRHVIGLPTVISEELNRALSLSIILQTTFSTSVDYSIKLRVAQ